MDVICPKLICWKNKVLIHKARTHPNTLWAPSGLERIYWTNARPTASCAGGPPTLVSWFTTALFHILFLEPLTNYNYTIWIYNYDYNIHIYVYIYIYKYKLYIYIIISYYIISYYIILYGIICIYIYIYI